MRVVAVALAAVLAVGVALAQEKKPDPFEKAKEAVARATIATLDRAVQVYFVKEGSFPPDLKTLTEGKPPIIEKRGLLDPWKKPYQYEPAGKKNKGKKPDIWTVTPDKKVSGNWEEKKKEG